MNRRLRFFILLAFGILTVSSLVQVFYRIAKDGPLLDMNLVQSVPVWAQCNRVYANIQMDTVASCVQDDKIYLSLSLRALRPLSRQSFVFKEGRYDVGRYRTYHNEGVSNGVGFTNALSPNEVPSRIYMAVDSVINQDGLTDARSLFGQYITISDDDSKLLAELRLPRRSNIRITLDSSSTGILLKIIAEAR